MNKEIFKKEIKKIVDEKGDYIFRFELFEKQIYYENSEDILVEVLKDIIKSIIEICVFTYKGEEVKIDGFKLIGVKDEKIYNI